MNYVELIRLAKHDKSFVHNNKKYDRIYLKSQHYQIMIIYHNDIEILSISSDETGFLVKILNVIVNVTHDLIDTDISTDEAIFQASTVLTPEQIQVIPLIRELLYELQ